MQMSVADRLTAVVLSALGIAMAVGGYRMDRLEIRRIHPASIPGLVPMILGGLIVVCAIVLWREAARSAGTEGEARMLHDGSWTRLGLTAGTSLGYALVLVGWLPFFWSTSIFVLAFALIFTWPQSEEPPSEGLRAQALAAAWALAIALATAWGTSVLFSEVFLVRLP